MQPALAKSQPLSSPLGHAERVVVVMDTSLAPAPLSLGSLAYSFAARLTDVSWKGYRFEHFEMLKVKTRLFYLTQIFKRLDSKQCRALGESIMLPEHALVKPTELLNRI